MSEPHEHLTVHLSPKQLARLREEAALHGFSLNDAVTQAIALWMDLIRTFNNEHFVVIPRWVNTPKRLEFYLEEQGGVHNLTWIGLRGDTPENVVDAAVRQIGKTDPSS